MSRFLWILVWLGLGAGLVAAQGLTALARVDPERSVVEDRRNGGVSLALGLSQPVPWRVFVLDAPPRLVLDFSEVDWTGLEAEAFDRSKWVSEVAMGSYRAGWSRMVLALDAPLTVASAGMRSGTPAVVDVLLQPVSEAAFAAEAGEPESAGFVLPRPEVVAEPRPRQRGDRPVVVALDPGHGGIDPGAERDGAREADLMLLFARELREVLRRDGFEVMLTREADIFVPLEMRQSLARAAGADVFLSLHADVVVEGRASGATVYTLADEASDVASEKLAERHDRGDLLAGVDLWQHDDEVAGVLMELARAETAPRSARLARSLVEGLRAHIGKLHKRPHLKADFSVLKAADIPSALIELGFLSSQADLDNLRSPEWRARAAAGIRDALRVWAAEDAAEAELLRQ